MIRLANPWFLLILLLIPVIVYLSKHFEKKMQSSFRFSNQELIRGIKPSLRTRLSSKFIYLRAVSIGLIVLAFARPQSVTEESKIFTEGIDIVLAIDVSGSMRAMDFDIAGRRVNRLEAVKRVVTEFIGKRPNDRMGMIAFSALAYTICPLTLDHDWLDLNLDRVNIGMMKDGTAIGSALSASLNRLKDTETKEKIVILLTDGRNNAGRITPMVAAEAAEALGVRVYTIGAGTKGMVPYPVKDMLGKTVLQPVKIDIDEELLVNIAEKTGGMYFRATDTDSLKGIYDRIDELEKTPMEEEGYNIYSELFPVVLTPALLLILLEIILSNTLLRRIP